MSGSRSGASGSRLVLAGALLLSLLGVAVAAPPAVDAQETGSVTFRLVIEGSVPADDDFALPRSSSECCFNDPVHVFCGAGIGTSAQPCEARTYEITYDQFSVGTVIDYAYQRWPAGNANAAETFYDDEVTVQEQAQVITVTYRYATGAPQPTPAAGQGTSSTAAPQASPPSAVPDTAMPPRLGDPVWASAILALLLIGLGIGGFVRLRPNRAVRHPPRV